MKKKIRIDFGKDHYNHSKILNIIAKTYTLHIGQTKRTMLFIDSQQAVK